MWNKRKAAILMQQERVSVQTETGTPIVGNKVQGSDLSEVPDDKLRTSPYSLITTVISTEDPIILIRGYSSGTAYVVAKRYLFTSAHVVWGDSGLKRGINVVLDPSDLNNFSTPWSYPVQGVFIPNSYTSAIGDVQTMHDYALLDLGQDVFSSVIEIRGEITGMPEVTISGYPSAKSAHRGGDMINPNKQCKASGTAIEIELGQRIMEYPLTAYPGMSGSPVLVVADTDPNKFYSIGIHRGSGKSGITNRAIHFSKSIYEQVTEWLAGKPTNNSTYFKVERS